MCEVPMSEIYEEGKTKDRADKRESYFTWPLDFDIPQITQVYFGGSLVARSFLGGFGGGGGEGRGGGRMLCISQYIV